MDYLCEPNMKICLNPITSPPLCATPCGQCLTQLALRNETQQLHEYISTVGPFNPYVVVRFEDFIEFGIEGYDTRREMSCLHAYLFNNSAHNHNQLNEETKPTSDERSAYSILPCYLIIFKADWILPEVISTILQSNIVDPIEIQEAVKIQEYTFGTRKGNGLLEFDVNTTGLTLLTALYQSSYQSHLRELLRYNRELIARQFPQSTLPFQWSGRSLLAFFLSPPVNYLYLVHEDPVRWNRFLNLNCLFQLKVAKPLLDYGLDLNSPGLHVLDFSEGSDPVHLNLIKMFIANGLMDFSNTSNLSAARLLLTIACQTWHCATPFHMEKAHHLLHLMHSLGSSYQLTTAQKDNEVHFAGQIKARDYVGLDRLLVRQLKDDGSRHRYLLHTMLEKALELVKAERIQPHRLCEVARIGVRNGVGGRWFADKVARLPLPPSLKDYVQADISMQFAELDRGIEFTARNTG